MLFDGIQHPAGGAGAAGFIREGVGGAVLVGQRNRRPEVDAVLADGHIQQVAAVVVLGHGHAGPGDGDLISVTAGTHVSRGIVEHTRPGQAHLLVDQLIDITNHFHYAGGDPAPVIQFIQLDVQPGRVLVTPAHRARIAGVQVAGMQEGRGRAVAAVRLGGNSEARQGIGGGKGWAGRERPGGRQGEGGGQRGGKSGRGCKSGRGGECGGGRECGRRQGSVARLRWVGRRRCGGRCGAGGQQPGEQKENHPTAQGRQGRVHSRILS